MVPWIDVINFWGFNISYVEANKKWNYGLSVGFSFRRFHIGFGIDPNVRDDYELS